MNNKNDFTDDGVYFYSEIIDSKVKVEDGIVIWYGENFYEDYGPATSVNLNRAIEEAEENEAEIASILDDAILGEGIYKTG